MFLILVSSPSPELCSNNAPTKLGEHNEGLKCFFCFFLDVWLGKKPFKKGVIVLI